MRTLTIMEHISLDGVIQHSADDDEFPYSNWTAPYRTAAGRDALLAAYGERFDLLLGRRTYDIWSGFWPQAPASRETSPAPGEKPTRPAARRPRDSDSKSSP